MGAHFVELMAIVLLNLQFLFEFINFLAILLLFALQLFVHSANFLVFELQLVLELLLLLADQVLALLIEHL